MVYDKEYFRLYAQKQHRKAIVLLGGCCAKCGTTESLEFDHVDPSTKSFHISSRLASLKSPDVIAELKKCQLLCEKCHLEKTLAERAKATHGLMQSWMRHKCKCVLCVAARNAWNEKRRAVRIGLNPKRGPYTKNVDHGTRGKYRRGCRCRVCIDKNTERIRLWRNKKK